MSTAASAMRATVAPAASRGRWLIAGHVLLLGGGLALWEWAVATGLIAQFIVSRPSVLVVRLVELLSEGTTWGAVRVTMTEVALGLVLGGGAGMALGVLISRSRRARGAFDPLVLAFYTLPRLALVPLFIVWFGLGLASKVAVVFIHGFVLFLLGAYAAMDSLPRDYESSFTVMGGSRLALAREVYLPHALPHLSTAFRQALGLGLGSAVVAELVGAFDGMGYEMGLRLARFDMTGTLAWVFLAATLAVGLDTIVRRAERRVFRWQ